MAMLMLVAQPSATNKRSHGYGAVTSSLLTTRKAHHLGVLGTIEPAIMDYCGWPLALANPRLDKAAIAYSHHINSNLLGQLEPKRVQYTSRKRGCQRASGCLSRVL